MSFVHVLAADPLPGHRLRLRFDDGAEGVVDLSGELWGEVFGPLRDPHRFAEVSVDAELGTVTCPTGADFDPSVLRARIVVVAQLWTRRRERAPPVRHTGSMDLVRTHPLRRLAPIALALVLLVLAAALAACGSASEERAGGVTPPADQARSADRAFLASMVPHHRSATEMAVLARDRAELPAIRRIARDIAEAQPAEIEQMRRIHQRLLGAPLREDMGAHMALGLGAQEAGMDHMDGAAQIARADPFDRAFIDEMVPHHQGATRMAEAVRARTKDGEVRALAERIIQEQRREIAEMQRIREREFGAPVPDRAYPAARAGGERPG